MFLNRLNEDEKVAFLELAHHMARSNNDFSQAQQSIIGQYCLEMQIEDINYDEKDYNLSEILKKIDNKSSQKIVLLEIMALVYSNQKIDKEEQEVLDAMITEFNLTSSLVIVYGEWTKAILAISIQGSALIEL